MNSYEELLKCFEAIKSKNPNRYQISSTLFDYLFKKMLPEKGWENGHGWYGFNYNYPNQFYLHKDYSPLEGPYDIFTITLGITCYNIHSQTLFKLNLESNMKRTSSQHAELSMPVGHNGKDFLLQDYLSFVSKQINLSETFCGFYNSIYEEINATEILITKGLGLKQCKKEQGK